jgi:hypothetical protein
MAGSVTAMVFSVGPTDTPSILSQVRPPWLAQKRALSCVLHGGAPRPPGHGKKQEGPRSADDVPFVSPRRSLTLERRPLSKNRLSLGVSRPRPPRLRLPRHPGAIVFLEHKPVSTSSHKCTITKNRMYPTEGPMLKASVAPFTRDILYVCSM